MSLHRGCQEKDESWSSGAGTRAAEERWLTPETGARHTAGRREAACTGTEKISSFAFLLLP